MSSKSYIAIEDNRAFRCTLTKDEFFITPQMLDQMTSEVVRKTPPLFNLVKRTEGNVGFCKFLTCGKQAFMVMDVLAIIFNVSTSLEEDGAIVPIFNGHEASRMNLRWQVPVDMSVKLGVCINTARDQLTFGHQYLCAYDPLTWAAYKLPLGNLYGDARLCHGQSSGNFVFNNLADMALGVAELFKTSAWNADLISVEECEKCKKVFRWKPTNDSFEQLPSLQDWKANSTKIASRIVNEFMV